jgi:hypothetical protein
LAGLFLWLILDRPALADTLTFIPSGSPVNYSWFSAGNWYTYDAGTQGYVNAGRIPVATDSAVIFDSQTCNAAANSINLVALRLKDNSTLNGGNFVVSTAEMDSGSSFNGSTVDVLSEMDVVGGSCGVNTGSLTIELGAVCYLGPGGTGQLNFSGSVIYNAGQIVIYPNSDSFLEGGTNLFIFPGAIISGSSNAVLSVSGNINHNGTIRSDGGNFSVSSTTWSSTNGLGKFKTSFTNSALLFPAGQTVPTNVTFIYSGPGTSQFPNGLTVQGTAQIGVYDTNLMGWDNGTLQFAGTLGGAGLVHVAAAAGYPSELDCQSSSILNGPTVNIDAGGNLDFVATGSTGTEISGGVINNSGAATWKSGTAGLVVAAPAVFNNLAGGLFDCQITNSSVDGNITGNGLINNAGTLRKSKGANAIVFGASGPNFNNSSLLDIESGQVQLSIGTNRGLYNVASGTELWFGGNTNTLVAGGQIAGTNFVRVNQGGVLLLDTNLTLANFQLNTAGVLDGPANLTVTNTFNWPAGTIRGGGAINIPAGAVFNLNTGYNSNDGYITNRTVNNAGTAVLTNGFITPDVGFVFNNLAGALLEIDNNGGIGFPNPSPTPRTVLNNFGTIRDLSASTAPLAFNITNQGVVLIPTNRLNCYQYHQLAGTTMLASNTILNIGDSPSAPLTLHGGTLNCAGSIQGNVVNSGGLITLGSSPNIVTFSGSSGVYTQMVAGALAIKIGGTTVGTQYDQFNASSGALGGALDVSFINGFSPSLGDRYRVVASSYGGFFSGSFSSVNGVHAPNGLVLEPVYGYYAGYYEVTLVAANDPIPSALSRGGGLFTFNYPSTAGFTNVVEYTDSLNPANWQPFVTNVGDGTVKSVTNAPPAAGQRFFRVRFQ